MVVGNCKWPDRSVAAIQCCQFSQIWYVTRFFFFKERLVTASLSDSCGRFDGFIQLKMVENLLIIKWDESKMCWWKKLGNSVITLSSTL